MALVWFVRAREVRRLESDFQAAQVNNGRLMREIKKLAQSERTLDAAGRSASGTTDRPAIASSATAESALAGLKQWLGQHPDKQIPEMGLLPEYNLGEIAATLRPGSETDLRQGVRMLRNRARQVFGEEAAQALASYAEIHGGMLPTSPTELKPYFDVPVDEAMLGRYRLLAQGSYAAAGPKLPLLGEVSGVDDDFDSVLSLSRTGLVRVTSDRSVTEIQRALHRYLAAQAGRAPDNILALAPYLETPLSNEVLSKFLINSEFTVTEKK